MADTKTAAATKVRVGKASELLGKACSVVQAAGHTLALFTVDDKVFAVDNRCPHMGFPLDRGSVQDGILTCYWHYARFDLASGGTFDLFADDVPPYHVTIEDGVVWVDLTPRGDKYDKISRRRSIGCASTRTNGQHHQRSQRSPILDQWASRGCHQEGLQGIR